MTALSFLLALAIGWLMVLCFDPLRDFASGPRWARSLFRISLAVVGGLGFTSLTFLLLRMAGVSRPLWFVTVDVVCARDPRFNPRATTAFRSPRKSPRERTGSLSPSSPRS